MAKTSKSSTIVVIAGPNGAGKSTSAPFLLKGALSVLEFVNADQIAVGLSAYAPERVAFEAGRIMLERLRELRTSGQDFAFETTLASRSFALFLREAKTSGYRVLLYYITLPSPELAVERVALRVRQGGHHIPTPDVIRRFERSLFNFHTLYRPLVDRWEVLDNSTGRLEPIASGTAKRAQIQDRAKWQQLQRKLT
jgi:predicted ABC-type ATPase